MPRSVIRSPWHACARSLHPATLRCESEGGQRRPRRVLALSGDTLRSVILFAPSTPAVQIFIRTMRTLDRSQLIIEIRQRFAAQCCRRNRDDSAARSIFTQPPYVDLARHHLLRRPDIDVAQRG
jgi:hypothetical protein